MIRWGRCEEEEGERETLFSPQEKCRREKG
jgi:hypothetical protein